VAQICGEEPIFGWLGSNCPSRPSCGKVAFGSNKNTHSYSYFKFVDCSGVQEPVLRKEGRAFPVICL